MEKRDKVYFITGANGFVGRHLVEDLAKEACHIRCLDHRSTCKGLFNYQNVTTIPGDLLDRESLERAIGSANICIHLASIINAKNKAEFERVNIEGMEKIVDVCSEKALKKFIYISTSDALVNPDSLYGRTKIAAEEVLKRSSLKYTIIRPTVVYGEYDDKNISTIVNFVKYSPIIPMIGDGKYKRQPTYVGDLIYAIKKCIDSEKTDGKIYNVGGASTLSMNEIVQTVMEVLNKKRLIIHLPTTLVKKLCLLFGNCSRLLWAHTEQILSIEKDKKLDITKTEEELDFNPTEFRDGLRMMLKKG